jgi:hypothetical protein
MTTPPSITVSLDTAKKLAKAGYPQEDSLFSMVAPEGFTKPYHTIFTHLAREAQGWRDFTFAAPTAEEILRRLPKTIGKGYKLHIHPSNSGIYKLRYVRWKVPREIKESKFEDISLANAAAAMWICLKEYNLLQS